MSGGKSKLTVKRGATSSKNSLAWAWKSGTAVASGDLGDPVTQTGFAVCVYDAAGRQSAATVSAGGSCLGKPCWKAMKGGSKYSNADATGSKTSVLLKAGLAGKARIKAKGRGQALDLPSLPLVVPVTMDLMSSTGRCWSARYSDALVTTGNEFKAKSE